MRQESMMQFAGICVLMDDMCARQDAACQTKLLSNTAVLIIFESFVQRRACSEFTAHAVCKYIVDMSIPVTCL